MPSAKDPLPAAFEVEVVDRGIAEIEREGAWLEAGENRVTSVPNRFQSDPPSI